MSSGSNRLDATLLVLVALAIATVCVPMLAPAALLGNAVLLVLAVLKGRRILLDYLDLRTAPAIWRGLVSAWVVLVAAFAWAASAAVAFLT